MWLTRPIAAPKTLRRLPYQPVGASTIDAGAHTVTFHMANGTAVTALVPIVTVSAGATVSPLSGVAPDFTEAVTYTVTAEDSSSQAWTVTCVVDPALSSAKDITAFAVPGQVGASTIDAGTHTVTFHMANGTAVTALVPIVTVSASATVAPLSGAAPDFTGAVTYTVTAEDSTTQA